jgi:hypothetical protein
VEHGEKELRSGIWVLGVVSERPKDVESGPIIAAQHGADAVFRRGLRRSRRGEQAEQTHEPRTLSHDRGTTTQCKTDATSL